MKNCTLVLILFVGLCLFNSKNALAWNLTCEDVFTEFIEFKQGLKVFKQTPSTRRVDEEGYASIPLKHGMSEAELTAIYDKMNLLRESNPQEFNYYGVTYKQLPELQPVYEKVFEKLEEEGFVNREDGVYYAKESLSGQPKKIKDLSVFRTDMYLRVDDFHTHPVRFSLENHHVVSVSYALMGNGAVVNDARLQKIIFHGPEEMVVMNEIENHPSHRSGDGKRLMLLMILTTE